MKRHCIKAVLGVPFCVAAVVAQDIVSEVGPNHRVWTTVSDVTAVDGSVVRQTNSFVQLEPGLHRLERGNWVPADDTLEIINNTVVARNTRHRVIWAANANTRGALDVELPDGQQLRGGCLGLSYYDTETGESVLIAELKDSTAELQPPNMVLYPDAFDDVDADLLYVNSKGGLEQFVILRSSPPGPEKYGLNPDTTRLEVISEFIDAPVPDRKRCVVREETEPAIRARMVEPDLVDEFIDFGPMFMGQGQAFLPAGEPSKLVAAESLPMAKRWEVIEGRTVLFEAVEYPSLRPLLTSLERNDVPIAQLRKASKERALPAQRLAATSTRPVQMATRGEVPHGLFLDYTLSSGVTNFTFRSDTTYYVTASVSLTGTNTTFEGGTVIKFANSGSPALNLASSKVTWLGSAYRPVTLTGSDDCSIGSTVSTGAFTGYYAETALNISSPLTGVVTRHLRILRAKTGIKVNYGTYHYFYHSQFVACGTGVQQANSTIVRLRNALMSDVNTNLNLSSAVIAIEHLTVNGATLFNTGGTVALKNCLVVNYGNTNSWSGSSNVFLTGASGVFAAAAAGSNYLASGSAYRNAGDPSISSELAADLKSMTTVAPTGLGSTISANATLSPQVDRDDDTQDLGYHYAALDYYGTAVTVTNATLLMTNGVAVGFYGSSWLVPRDGATVESVGRPEQLNHLAPLLQVQEQPGAGYASLSPTALFPFSSATNRPTARLRFTSIDNMDGYVVYQYPSSCEFALVDARHSSFGSAGFYAELTSTATSVALVNNLCERQSLQFLGTFGLTAYNNLVRNGEFYVLNDATNLAVVVKDNAFDNSAAGSLYPVTHGYNAYINAGWRFEPTNANDKVLSSFIYTNSYLGPYYHASSNLLDAGSRSGASAGLYHFTVLKSQAKDTNTVDIGFHYVATDATGTPLDTDADGSPDYAEDANGNGNVDSGETNWQNADDYGLWLLITTPKAGARLP